MSKAEKVRYHMTFYGQVQGVGFRYRARHAAVSLGLTGWVKNEWDGSVEMEIQGDADSINHMISRIVCSPYIVITNRTCSQLPIEQESGFHIR